MAFMPVGVFLGLAIYSAQHPIYPHYANLPFDWAPAPMDDQRLAGEIMWVGGMLLNLAALPFLIFGWFRHERREAERVDRRLDREAVAAEVSSPTAEG
jgi:cytochrome c oxidase assembly factor CtaG